MARKKGIPHRSPDSFTDAQRQIPAQLRRLGSNPARQEALLRYEDPNKVPIPTDWMAQVIKEAKKPQRQKDLERADRIISARLDGKTVAAEDLEWLNKFQKVIEAEHEAENATISADNSDVEKSGDDIDNDGQEVAAARLTAGNLEPLNTSAAPALDDDANCSSLSEVSNVSALNPDCSPKQKRVVRTKPPTSFHPVEKENKVASEVALLRDEAELDKRRPVLESALNTLQYDNDPADRPDWIKGLRKPLPHRKLTELEDLEILARLWDDEIDRLQKTRSKRAVPKDVDPGEWQYEHYGDNTEIHQRKNGIETKVHARGMWRYIVGGKCVRQGLDEVPLSVLSQPIDWSWNAKAEGSGTNQLTGSSIPLSDRTRMELDDGVLMKESVEEKEPSAKRGLARVDDADDGDEVEDMKGD